MKKRPLLALLITCLLVCLALFTISAAADGAEDVTLEIKGGNLTFGESIYIDYAVAASGVDVESVELLIWDKAATNYVKGSEKYSYAPSEDTKTVGGVECRVFTFDNIVAKQLADDFYAVAYAKVGDTEYYSAPIKYSVLRYAYAKLGLIPGSASNSATYKALLTNMLKYCAAVQTHFGYHTDRLADANYYLVSVVGGSLSDGFNWGLYQEGDKVTVTAPEKNADGCVFAGWLDENGEKISSDMTAELTVGAKNTTYTASYEKYYSAGLEYAQNDDGRTCYVSGIGDCSDTDVIIPAISPEGYAVTGIGPDAFAGCSDLISVTLPNSVRSIDAGAFEGCSSLSAVIYYGTPEQYVNVLVSERNEPFMAITSTFITCADDDHIPVNFDAKAPTCTEIGWNAYVSCARCGYTTYVEQAALGHTIETELTIPPTCTESGYEKAFCNVCDWVKCDDEGNEIWYDVPALNHDATEWNKQYDDNRLGGHWIGEVSAPTCVDNAVWQWACDLCNTAATPMERTGTDENGVCYDATGHTFYEYDADGKLVILGQQFNVYDPTCTTLGYTEITCRDCSVKNTDDREFAEDDDEKTVWDPSDELLAYVDDDLEHEYTADAYIPPKCNGDGTYEYAQWKYVCEDCGHVVWEDDKSVAFDVKDVTHHSTPILNADGYHRDPTCTVGAIESYYCVTCNRDCCAIRLAQHEFEDGVCVKCGNDEAAPPDYDCEANGHKVVTAWTTTPTCTQYGFSLTFCRECSWVECDYNGNANYVLIPSFNHNANAWNRHYDDNRLGGHWISEVSAPTCVDNAVWKWACDLCDTVENRERNGAEYGATDEHVDANGDCICDGCGCDIVIQGGDDGGSTGGGITLPSVPLG